MKVLILSCNTGEGHNSCAKALKIAMDRNGVECQVEDTLALVNQNLSHIVDETYVFSTKTSIFELAYKVGDFVSEKLDNIKSPVYRSNKLYANKLYDYIVENGFEAVVCVHLFPAEALTALHRKAKLNVPTYFVMTDYTCIPFLSETELDHYIIPHEHLIEEFVEKGLPRNKIVPMGIPVDEELFCSRLARDVARDFVCSEMGWKSNDVTGDWYLIMSGSMGYGNLGDLVDELLHRIKAEDRVVCICGRNEKTYNTLKGRFDDERVLLVGFTDKVPIMMDASDVMFTKPGGITSTEAIVKGIPLVHTAPIPGLENSNALFFHYHNLSYFSEDVQQQVTIAIRLVNDEVYREKMIRAQSENANRHTSDDVVKLILLGK